jgi:hypothetical protein
MSLQYPELSFWAGIKRERRLKAGNDVDGCAFLDFNLFLIQSEMLKSCLIKYELENHTYI